MLPCPEKTKLRLNSGRFEVFLSLMVCALLEIVLLVQMEASEHTKTLRSDLHPYRYPLYFWPHQLQRQELRSYLHLP